MDTDHEVDECSLQSGASAAVDGEARARDLGAGLEGQHAQRLTDLPVRAAMLAVGPFVGCGLAPAAHDDAGLLAADRHAGIGRVGDAQHELLELGLHPGQVAVQRIDPSAHIDPQVVFDTRSGPIVVEAGAVIQAFSRIEGPCHIGRQSQVLGAKLRGGCTLSDGSRVDTDDPQRHQVLMEFALEEGVWKVAGITDEGDGCTVGS